MPKAIQNSTKYCFRYENACCSGNFNLPHFKNGTLRKQTNKQRSARCIVETFCTSASPDKSSERYKISQQLKARPVIIAVCFLCVTYNKIQHIKTGNHKKKLDKTDKICMAIVVKLNTLNIKTFQTFLVILMKTIILQWYNLPQNLLPTHKVVFQTHIPKISF